VPTICARCSRRIPGWTVSVLLSLPKCEKLVVAQNAHDCFLSLVGIPPYASPCLGKYRRWNPQGLLAGRWCGRRRIPEWLHECPLRYSQDNCRIPKQSRSRRKRHRNVDMRPIYAPCRAEIIVNRTGDRWRPRDAAGPRDSSRLLARFPNFHNRFLLVFVSSSSKVY